MTADLVLAIRRARQASISQSQPLVDVVKTALIPNTARETSASAITKATAATPTDTAIIKVPPITPAPTPSSGLSKTAIIGLATGVLVCMIAVFAATCMTIRKLRRSPRSKKPHADTRFKDCPRQSNPDDLQTSLNPISSQPPSHSRISQQPTGYRIVPDTYIQSPVSSPNHGRSISNGQGGSVYHPLYHRASTDSSATQPHLPGRSTRNTHELEAVSLPRNSVSSGVSGTGSVRTEPQNLQGYSRHHQHQHLAGVAESSPTAPEFESGIGNLQANTYQSRNTF
ncbi:MAG: hypothetical protein M1840_000857 [Geoglossum simile]|nr:MAG: hypothetical protein M1840_000857 [Geoglossum simile]